MIPIASDVRLWIATGHTDKWEVLQHVSQKFVCRPAKRTPTAGPLTPDCARACRPQAARPSPVCQVRHGPAARS